MTAMHSLPRLMTVLFAALLVLSACASLPPVQPGTLVTRDAGRALLDDWLAASSQRRSLQGVAKVRVQTGERTVSGTQVILAEQPDRLRAETLSPFGTPLLVLAAGDGRLAVLFPGENTFYSGAATPDNLGRFTQLPLHLEDLIDILLSRPPLLNDRNLETYRLPDGGWRVELEAGARRQLLVFDADRQLQEVDYLENGELQLRLDYGGFDAELAGFPRRIDLFIPRQQTRAGLAFSELATNSELQAGLFTLTPPAGAVPVDLDEASASGGDPQLPAQAGAR